MWVLSRFIDRLVMIDNKEELVLKHLELVIKMNKIVNLTRIESFSSGRLLHIEDSLSGLEDLNKCSDGVYGDMGCGAGFPGIPLAIYSGRETVLIDSVGKKTKAIDGFIKELNLNNVKTYNGRIEDLAQVMPKKFTALTARALSSLSSLIELASPLLMDGGRLICYKAHIEEEEIKHVKDLENKLGMKFLYKRDFLLSDNETNRCIIVFKKTSQPEIKLPRRVGLAQKKPF